MAGADPVSNVLGSHPEVHGVMRSLHQPIWWDGRLFSVVPRRSCDQNCMISK